MPFVFEKIPAGERDKLKDIDSPLRSKKLDHLEHWIIDRDRDAFLMFVGGHGGQIREIPSYYALKWKGKVMYFRAVETESGSLSGQGLHVYRKFINFSVPQELQAEQDYIKHLLHEAFDVYGFAGRNHNVTVHLEFQPTKPRG